MLFFLQLLTIFTEVQAKIHLEHSQRGQSVKTTFHLAADPDLSLVRSPPTPPFHPAIDRESKRLGVTRQSVIKVWFAKKLEQHQQHVI